MKGNQNPPLAKQFGKLVVFWDTLFYKIIIIAMIMIIMIPIIMIVMIPIGLGI